MANELYLYGVIGGGLFEEGVTDKYVVGELKKMVKNQPLDVFINSPGGSVSQGVAIYNNLQRWPGGVTTHVDGWAASIASVIALAGSEVVMASGSEMMIHPPWTIVDGNAKSLRETADLLDHFENDIVGIYVKRTGLAEDKVRDMIAAETWMSAEEAVAFGFASRVDESIEAMAYTIPEAMNLKHPPRKPEPAKQRPANKLAAMQRQLDLTRTAFCR